MTFAKKLHCAGSSGGTKVSMAQNNLLNMRSSAKTKKQKNKKNLSGLSGYGEPNGEEHFSGLRGDATGISIAVKLVPNESPVFK